MGWTISRSWGGIITEEPAVVSWGPRRLDVFARGGDGRLHHWWGDDDRWGGPEPLGRMFADVFNGSPHAVSWAAGRLDIFAEPSMAPLCIGGSNAPGADLSHSAGS